MEEPIDQVSRGKNWKENYKRTFDLSKGLLFALGAIIASELLITVMPGSLLTGDYIFNSDFFSLTFPVGICIGLGIVQAVKRKYYFAAGLFIGPFVILSAYTMFAEFFFCRDGCL